jgi:amino acid adenylation domain-containing protein
MIYQLQQLLSETARTHSEQVAVTHNESRITYGELDELSSRLAQVLVRAGVGRGDRVGIYLEKSIPAVVSMFGILKAEAAYVPLDPASPPKRVRYIVADCAVRHVITSTERAEELAAVSATFILVDRDSSAAPGTGSTARAIPWGEVETARAEQPRSGGVESDLAYILYTSGSTGTPKGVMISHRAALTFVDWTHDEFGMSSTDVVSSHAPLHFDLSIFDIFTTVKAGGTIALVPEGTSTFPVRLSQWIVGNGITVWYSVPSALTLLVTRGNLERYDFSRLRVVLFAGEVFPVKYLRALRRAWPGRFYNLYGPTETNVCTFYEVGDIPEDRRAPYPIGSAIPNCEVFAVNERDERIGPGESGELYVRGPSLMSGYWGRPDKTRGVLMPNRFQPAFEEKVYRTGDLVHLEHDGNYVYLGRRDSMVKVRGYRVEPGEIEAVLYNHPRVKQAAVVPVPDEQVTNRLAAFVVAEGDEPLTGAELQAFCARSLPRYMVPEITNVRDSLPQTSTGKIDRTSLR